MKKYFVIPALVLFMAGCGSPTEPKKGDSDTIKDQGSKNDTEQVNTVESNQIKTGGKTIHLTEDEFAQQVFDFRKGGNWKYKGDKPCMVDFYADWCGPCRSIAPFMEEFAKTYKDRIYIYKINTDYAQDLSMYFSINAIPAVMFCPMKGEYKMVVGSIPKEEYMSKIESILLSGK
jgi:thioredoxin